MSNTDLQTLRELLPKIEVKLTDARAAVQRAAETEVVFQDTGRNSELVAVRRNKDWWKSEREHYQELRAVVLAMLGDADPGPAYLSFSRVEGLTGLTHLAVLRMVQRGELEAVRVGGQDMVSAESLSGRFPGLGGLL